MAWSFLWTRSLAMTRPPSLPSISPVSLPPFLTMCCCFWHLNLLSFFLVIRVFTFLENNIGDDGAKHFSELLKKVKSVSSLDLSCPQSSFCSPNYYFYFCNIYVIVFWFAATAIGDTGASHLSEALRMTSTLASINLSCISSIWWLCLRFCDIYNIICLCIHLFSE